MTVPFFRGFDRTDFIFVSTVAQALAADDFPAIDNSFGALGPGVTSHRPGSLLVPDSYLYISDDYVIVLIQGTEGIGQWLGQLLLSTQFPFVNYDGLTAIIPGNAANAIVSDINDVVVPRLTTRKLVCMGFSLGGAIAQLIGSNYRTLATQGLAVLAIGAPRVGNPTFASAMDPFVWRLNANRDPVPPLPPANWQPIGSAYPVPGTGVTYHYQHAGQGATLDDGGTIIPGDNFISQPAIVQQLATVSVPTHATAWYLSHLLIQSDLATLPPGGDGYPDPPILYAQTRAQQGLPISGRPFLEDPFMPSQLVQGILYFRNKSVSEGWGETIYNVGDIPTMNGLLSSLITPRSLFLANDCEIHAYRSAYVGGTKLSQTTKFASPQTGQAADPVNEVGDAILYNYKSQTNAHRILTFRAVPDGAIEKNQLSPAGNALIPAINSYCQALINAGVGIKVPDPTVLVQNIQSIQNLVAGGPLQVTSALAHGLDQGDHVNIAGIRDFPYLIGKWKVGAVTPTTFILVGSQRYNASLGAVGTFQGIEYVLQTANSFGFNMVAFRKTGKPFGQPRGKRAKRLLRS